MSAQHGAYYVRCVAWALADMVIVVTALARFTRSRDKSLLAVAFGFALSFALAVYGAFEPSLRMEPKHWFSSATARDVISSAGAIFVGLGTFRLLQRGFAARNSI